MLLFPDSWMTLAFIGGIGAWEMGIILVIALLLFGRRLPEVMRGLGSGVREFRKGMEADTPPSDAHRHIDAPTHPANDAPRPDDPPAKSGGPSNG